MVTSNGVIILDAEFKVDGAFPEMQRMIRVNTER